MNYEELTDFEINKLVAKSLGLMESNSDILHYDYCNNPSDAWPIIFENKIGLFCALKSCGMWWADKKVYIDDGDYKGDYRSIMSGDKNPLRAACIVYLMLESENEN